jgi:hypothetical protein
LAFYGIRRFITLFARDPNWSLLRQLNLFHILRPIFKIHFNIIPTCTPQLPSRNLVVPLCFLYAFRQSMLRWCLQAFAFSAFVVQQKQDRVAVTSARECLCTLRLWNGGRDICNCLKVNILTVVCCFQQGCKF